MNGNIRLLTIGKTEFTDSAQEVLNKQKAAATMIRSPPTSLLSFLSSLRFSPLPFTFPSILSFLQYFFWVNYGTYYRIKNLKKMNKDLRQTSVFCFLVSVHWHREIDYWSIKIWRPALMWPFIPLNLLGQLEECPGPRGWRRLWLYQPSEDIAGTEGIEESRQQSSGSNPPHSHFKQKMCLQLNWLIVVKCWLLI